MKQFFPFFCFFASFLPNLLAQSPVIDRSFSGRFQSDVQCHDFLPDGGIVMGVRGNDVPGEIWSDSLYVYILDTIGSIVLKKTLPKTTSEIHYFHQILHLPDGGFLISYEGTLCDVGSDMTVLIKTNENLEPVWVLEDTWEQPLNMPDEWGISPDGNLIGLRYNTLMKISAQTGDLIWEKELAVLPNQNIYNIQLIPGTEDFWGFGQPRIQKWVFTGVDYTMAGSANPMGFFSQFQVGTNGTVFAYEWSTKQINIFNPPFQTAVIPHNIDDLINFVSTPNGLYVCERGGSTTKIYQLGLDGTVGQNFAPFNNWLTGNVTWNANKLYVLGADHSGLSQSNYYIDPLNTWVRIYPSPQSTVPETSNAGITETMQLSGIDSSGIYSPFLNTTLYNLNGGDFRVKITNFGTSTLNKIRVNTRFRANEFAGICFNYPAQFRDYNNLNLAPGASVWMDFGDIAAQGQTMLVPICFWTSGPNDEPDFEHENDIFCTDPQFSVSTSEPKAFTVFRISPNPATEFLNVSAANPRSSDLPWQIVNTHGITLKNGSFKADISTQTIDLKGITPGIYYLKCGNWVGRFLVQKG